MDCNSLASDVSAYTAHCLGQDEQFMSPDLMAVEDTFNIAVGYGNEGFRFAGAVLQDIDELCYGKLLEETHHVWSDACDIVAAHLVDVFGMRR